VTTRGKWTASFIPRPLVRLWLTMGAASRRSLGSVRVLRFAAWASPSAAPWAWDPSPAHRPSPICPTPLTCLRSFPVAGPRPTRRSLCRLASLVAAPRRVLTVAPCAFPGPEDHFPTGSDGIGAAPALGLQKGQPSSSAWQISIRQMGRDGGGGSDANLNTARLDTGNLKRSPFLASPRDRLMIGSAWEFADLVLDQQLPKAKPAERDRAGSRERPPRTPAQAATLMRPHQKAACSSRLSRRLTLEQVEKVGRVRASKNEGVQLCACAFAASLMRDSCPLHFRTPSSDLLDLFEGKAA